MHGRDGTGHHRTQSYPVDDDQPDFARITRREIISDTNTSVSWRRQPADGRIRLGRGPTRGNVYGTVGHGPCWPALSRGGRSGSCPLSMTS